MPSAPGLQGKSLEQSNPLFVGAEHGPSQKLASSFISSHTPENLTLLKSMASISSQYPVALGWKKSTKVVVPGQTLPLYSAPAASLMNTPLLTPSLYAVPLFTLMPASMIGMQWQFCSRAFILVRLNLDSSMVKSSQSIMQSMSDQMVSSGMSLLLQLAVTFSRKVTFWYPHLHWWNPRDQKGGTADLPRKRWNLQIVSSAELVPRMNLKSIIPPMVLQVKEQASLELEFTMISMALEFLKQLMWQLEELSLRKQMGQCPQVCSPCCLSTTCPRSRLKTVYFPGWILNLLLNLSPKPHTFLEATLVLISMQCSLKIMLPTEESKRSSLSVLLMILKLKGLVVQFTMKDDTARGKEDLSSGSTTKGAQLGILNLVPLKSVIASERSEKEWQIRVKLRRLQIGLLSLMQYSSVPVYSRLRMMCDRLVKVLVTLQSEDRAAATSSTRKRYFMLVRIWQLLLVKNNTLRYLQDSQFNLSYLTGCKYLLLEQDGTNICLSQSIKYQIIENPDSCQSQS